jgi:hypothetical protein
MKYAVTSDSAKDPKTDPFAEADVKTQAAGITGQDAGTYYVWWWIDGDGTNYIGRITMF